MEYLDKSLLTRVQVELDSIPSQHFPIQYRLDSLKTRVALALTSNAHKYLTKNTLEEELSFVIESLEGNNTSITSRLIKALEILYQ